MARFNDALVLSTSGVAELLSVHPSTVKRWCNDGALPTDRTDGGHRRIHLEDVLELADRRGIRTFLDPFAPYQAHVWSVLTEIVEEGGFLRLRSLAMGWLTRGRHDRMGLLFETLARHPSVDLPRLLDGGVGGFMEDVGRCWREGRIRVGEEHLATQTLIEALLRLRCYPGEGRREAPAPAGGAAPDAPPRLAVVGSTDGDQHHVGALGVRLVLEARGWETLFLGPSVPVEDFHDVQQARGASLICISFSASQTGADPHRALRILEERYDAVRPYALALGGGGVDAGALSLERRPFRNVGAFRGTSDFLHALDAGFADGGRPAARRSGPRRVEA